MWTSTGLMLGLMSMLVLVFANDLPRRTIKKASPLSTDINVQKASKQYTIIHQNILAVKIIFTNTFDFLKIFFGLFCRTFMMLKKGQSLARILIK